jgi:hypothetical protein
VHLFSTLKPEEPATLRISSIAAGVVTLGSLYQEGKEEGREKDEKA